jgi:DNA polymerase I-like protein with 3'-5' exonuclease and polymerase domains
MPEIERLCRLAPTTESRVWVKADYGQIEPRVLLEILRRRGAIAWEAGGDLYRTLAGDEIDRDVVKVAVNKLINGGSPPAGAAGRLTEFIEAADAYRSELVLEAESAGAVVTLAGRDIPLDPGEPNFGGKVVNRVIQGTAADIFHRGVLRVDSAITTQGLPASVGFLLYDELWLECDPVVARIVAQVVVIELERAALSLGVMVPVRLKVEVPDDMDPYDTEERAATLEHDGGIERECAARAAGLR